MNFNANMESRTDVTEHSNSCGLEFGVAWLKCNQWEPSFQANPKEFRAFRKWLATCSDLTPGDRQTMYQQVELLEARYESHLESLSQQPLEASHLLSPPSHDSDGVIPMLFGVAVGLVIGGMTVWVLAECLKS